MMIELRRMISLLHALFALSGPGRPASSFRFPRIPTMMRPARLLFAAVVFFWLSSLNSALAQEPIRLARTPDISPDGKQIAFSYLGYIWTVEPIGGIARPVTMHEPHLLPPSYTPYRRSIAFSS